MKRILLLNPPGDKLYLRDYYCSKISKADYYYHPTDLLVLSGILAERYEVHVLDAILSRLSIKETLDSVAQVKPEVVIFLTGAVSRESDFCFISTLRGQMGARMIGIGDVLLEYPERILQVTPWLDAILLDFTQLEILEYLEGSKGPFESIIYRSQGGVVPAHWRPAKGQFEIPIPRHGSFFDRRYRHPFVRGNPMATVLTDYGCPFACHFCVMPTLGYKYRPVSNVMPELKAVASLGIREIYFNDQTFGVNKGRTLDLCRAMMNRGFGFRWTCFSRVDVVDEKLLEVMKAAGCHTITFGVESANSEILAASQKGITKEQVMRAFQMCQAEGIETAATFILGLPDETEEDMHASVELAIELGCDYASFNLAVPRMATKLRQDAIAIGLISPGTTRMDQSGTYAAMGTRHLSREETQRLGAIAIRKFYCRPRYIMQRLRKIRSWHDLKRHVRSGLAVLRNVILR